MAIFGMLNLGLKQVLLLVLVLSSSISSRSTLFDSRGYFFQKKISLPYFFTAFVAHIYLLIYYFSGLQKYIDQQGFNIVGYGCTTCIGNSGELNESAASAISDNGITHDFA